MTLQCRDQHRLNMSLKSDLNNFSCFRIFTNFQFSTFLTFQEIWTELHNRRNDPERGDSENYEMVGNVYKKKRINNAELTENQISEELSQLNNAFMETNIDNHNNSSGSQGSYFKKIYTNA